MGDSQLAGAQFEVLYYPNKGDKKQKYSSAEQAKEKGYDAVQFIFETRSVDLGTPQFSNVARDRGYDYGIDFRPLDEDTWQNKFIISGQAKYQSVFGQSGTYVIREYTQPKGYTLTGEMSASTLDGIVKTSSLRTGLALYVERTTERTIYEVNGHLAGSGDVNVAIEVEDEPDVPTLSTTALSMDTGQQYADPKSTNIRLRENIKVDVVEDREVLYAIRTWVQDEDENSIAVKWEGDSTATTKGKVTTFSSRDIWC